MNANLNVGATSGGLVSAPLTGTGVSSGGGVDAGSTNDAGGTV
jgi:hypothetical protein